MSRRNMEIKMLNVLKKTKPWMAAALATASCAFAQDGNNTKCRPQKSFEQGHELVQTQMMSGYNAPARIDVRGSWDIYADGSFIYWQVMQDNMEIGVSSVGTPSTVGNADGQQVYIINTNYEYSPGFKVGVGMNFDHDNWDANAEYTWLHNKISQVSNGQTNAVVYPINDWAARQNASSSFNSLVGKWHYKFDILDLMLGRSYYVGNRLSFRPAFGARGCWMRQHTSEVCQGSSQNGAGTDKGKMTNNYASWGVGPSASLSTSWMVGYGVAIVADIQADVQYRHFDIRQTFQTTTTSLNNTTFHQDHMKTLRPHTDFEMGLEYGTYFDNNNWHVELAATYGFQVFWNENVFRKYVGGSTNSVMNSFSPNGNMYIHGLTATARLDF